MPPRAGAGRRASGPRRPQSDPRAALPRSGPRGAGAASSAEVAGARGGAQGVGEAPSHFLLWGFGFYFHLLRPGEIYFLLAILLFLVASMS